MNQSKPLRGRNLLVCMVLLLLGFVACLKDLSPVGAPCKEDTDCWSSRFCVRGLCYDTKTPELSTEVAPEPAPEPTLEPRPEPTLEATPEPIPEAAQDAAPDQPQTPESTPEAPADQPPAVGRDLYQTCAWYHWALDTDKCKPGLVCHRIDAFRGYCLQDCSQDAKRCASNTDGRTTCRTIDWAYPQTAIRACVSEEEPGKACDPTRAIFCKLTLTNGGGICQNKICAKATLVREDEPCNPNETQPRLCDLSQQQICSNKNVCTKAIPKFEADSCARDSICPVGLSCVRNILNSPLCLKECKADLDCGGYEHPSQCYQGVCVQSECKQDFDCKYRTNPHLCTPGANGNLCIPTFSGGERKFGEICVQQSKVPAEGCAGTYRCFGFSSQAKFGLCLAHCQDDFDCTKYYPAGGYTCGRTPSKLGFRYCLHPCDLQKDIKCPEPLVCNQLCIPKE